MILTVDAGTSVVKVAIWDVEGLVAVSGIPIETHHPVPGWAEQDPTAWWGSVVRACEELGRRHPAACRSVDVVGCTGARQTFALFGATGEPVGPGIVWSDRRAGQEASALSVALGLAPGAPSPTGIVLDAASVAAKLAWLAGNREDLLDAAAWVMSPRDLIVWHLTGTVTSDPSMASRSGLYDAAGSVVEDLVGPAQAKLPPLLPSDQVAGVLTGEAALATGLAPGIPVVIGAGDRACEVLGTGSSETWPMVSWGTTANVSVPVPVAETPEPPPGTVASRAADGGWLLEGGLSAAGALVAWVSRFTGQAPEDLAGAARSSPPGARGVMAVPWLGGARAPWWREDAAAGLVGIGPAHGPADITRAVFEAVAWDVVRCLEAMASRRPAGLPVAGLALAGSGASVPVWRDALTGIAGVTATHRRSGQAASAGAARLAAGAVGLEFVLDVVDPVEGRTDPDPDRTDRYRRLRSRADSVAEALIGLAPVSTEDPRCS